MPVYEYQCQHGHVFTAFSTVAARLVPRSCAACGGLGRKVILTPPRVFSDYEGYESPASGKWIEGRRARVEDLARTGCRPYELGEREAMLRRQAENDRKMEEDVEVAVERTLNEITL